MRTVMLWLVTALGLAVAGQLQPGFAGEAKPEIVAEAQAVIAGQIEAFRADDGTKAYAFAAPEVQLKFQNPEHFMAMVRQGYGAVYRPKNFTFEAASEDNGLIRQLVDIVGPDGGLWTAEYVLRRMPDGSLKIAACVLKKREGVGA